MLSPGCDVAVVPKISQQLPLPTQDQANLKFHQGWTCPVRRASSQPPGMFPVSVHSDVQANSVSILVKLEGFERATCMP